MEPDAEAIKQLATDVNNVADASFQAGYKAGLKKAFEPGGLVDKMAKALERDSEGELSRLAKSECLCDDDVGLRCDSCFAADEIRRIESVLALYKTSGLAEEEK